MSLSQAAAQAEHAIGHRDNAITQQDITNPANNREKYGDPNETMKALAWIGKNKVEMSKLVATVQLARSSLIYPSRMPQAQGRRAPRCDPEGHRQHRLRQ